MARRKLTSSQYTDIAINNAGACCVCKRRGIGVNIHHIDHDSSNNNRENLAVLCVQDHDAHHRPGQYPAMNHLDLSAEDIRRYKREWEEFVAEAKKSEPRVLAVVNVYGTQQQIHSARLLFQWVDGRIVFERLYHLLNGPPNVWTDCLIEEVQWVGKEIKLVLVDEPLAIEYCPCCGNSLSNIINPERAKMLTVNDWQKKSVCSIYINQFRPSLAILIDYESECIVSMGIHKCGIYLHLMAARLEEQVPIRHRPSVRTQATALVERIVSEWNPGRVLIGTGDPDQPVLIENLQLPLCWES